MFNFDLRLLEIFEEIYRVKSVSAAADNLRLSQPAVSMGLRRLRERLGDPLFVRTSAGMEPTQRASELWEPLTRARSLIVEAVRHQSSFDPARSQRSLRLCMTDVSQVVILPDLRARLAEQAPQLRIDVVPVTAATGRMLEQADADLAIGSIAALEAGFMEQGLFAETFVCVTRADHPRIGATLTLKAFRSESHLEIVAPGTSHWLVTKALERRKIRLHIAMQLPSYLAVETVISRTDLICTVPRKLAESMRSSARIRIHEPPIEIPSYRIKQHWHDRYQQDPRHRWLREMIVGLFRSAAPDRARAMASRATAKLAATSPRG